MSDDELRAQMRSTVAEFLDAECGSQARRTAMDGERGYDRATFDRLVTELGLGGLVVPESDGGLGMGFAEAAVVLEELGRRTVPSPLPDTLVGATLLAEHGTGEQARAALRRLAAEPQAIAVCGLENGATSAGETLSGRLTEVPFGAAADLLLVLAAGEAGEQVYLVAPEQPGVVRHEQRGLDHTRRLSEIELSGAEAQRISPHGDGAAAAARLRALYRTALAAESAAAAAACLDGTVEYLKVREQFGRVLGSFQALKHRCADLAVDVRAATATAEHALALAASNERTDELGDDSGTVSILAKTVCTDTLMRVAADCLQLHGGIGFTFEHDLHLWLKRGKANQLLAGANPQLHERLAELAL